jgi:excisionase family DNA binding protein
MAKTSKPSKQDQILAKEAIDFLEAHSPSLLKANGNGVLNLTIEEQAISFEVPRKAFAALVQTLRKMSDGKSSSIESFDTILSTQNIADRLGASRPHVVKLLENGEINFTKVGSHRRVKLGDLLDYKMRMENEY